MDTHFSISTYIVNLKSRKDRLKHIKQQFKNKPEFDFHIIEACLHEKGNMGLWQSFQKVIKIAEENDDGVIIFVEDDHIFTEHYQWNFLFNNIVESNKQGLDILLGGITGGFKNVVPITKNRLWVDHFWGTQFTIIYKRFYSKILEANFEEKDTLDDFLSNLTPNKMVLYPFISIQKEFGYSDVTKSNNIEGNITTYFEKSSKILDIYASKFEKYSQIIKK